MSALTAPTAAAKSMSAELPAQLAKAALRRLALDKLEPTPDNYARAYQLEQGGVPPAALPERAQRAIERVVARGFEGDVATSILSALADGDWERAERAISQPPTGGDALASLIERLVRGVERGGKQWTTARKKDSLQRVLGGSRGDNVRLQQRLRQLVTNWETDTVAETETPPAEAASAATPSAAAAPLPGSPAAAPAAATEPDVSDAGATAPAAGDVAQAQPPPVSERAVVVLGQAVVRSLPSQDAISRTLADSISQAAQRFRQDSATEEHAREIEVLCERADWVLQHREHLFDQVSGLCLELTSSLTELAEDDSWAQGQCDAMRLTVEEGLIALDALKQLINRMLSELGELGSQTGRFHESVGRYADVIESAGTLEELTGVVREMVEESRTVQVLVSHTQRRLAEEHTRATDLSQRVGELEDELRRLSSEVSTDQLTQIANRRGLLQAFDLECSRLQRAEGDVPDENKPAGLSIGLLDIDNFKRLNDELGHAAGDEALKALAATVSKTLRPTDMVARYGGEEFVVLLPDTPVDEGQLILTRLQRSLTGGLFMHENQQIFVTFSAGVTAYCPGERIEDALQRADLALYQAKRAGKNRTFIG